MTYHPETRAAGPVQGPTAKTRNDGGINSTSRSQCKPFVPAWLDEAGLTAAEMRVFVHLLRSADNKTGVAWPSYRRMIEITGLSKNTIRRSIETLEKPHGLIAKMGKPFAGSCRYRVLPIVPPEGQMESSNSPTREHIETAPIVPPEIHNSPSHGTSIVPPEGQEGSPKKVIHRRESNMSFPTPEDLPFQSEEVSQAWSEWLQHLSQKPKAKRPTESALKSQRRKIHGMTEREAISILRHSVEKNYQGLYQDPAFQPDAGKPSSFEEVRLYAAECRVSADITDAYWHNRKAVAWRRQGQPIANWRSDFAAFVETFNRNAERK